MQKEAFISGEERSVGQGGSEALTSQEGISFVGRSFAATVIFLGAGVSKAQSWVEERGCSQATVVPKSAGGTDIGQAGPSSG